VLIDSHIYDQYVVPPFYDSLLAKLIVHADTRAAAVRRLERCLDEIVIEGIQTNVAFHRRLVEHPDFIDGSFDTHFLEKLSRNEG
jgi:acetyl-CoA carboxylase biotin carboxylase subunit